MGTPASAHAQGPSSPATARTRPWWRTTTACQPSAHASSTARSGDQTTSSMTSVATASVSRASFLAHQRTTLSHGLQTATTPATAPTRPARRCASTPHASATSTQHSATTIPTTPRQTPTTHAAWSASHGLCVSDPLEVSNCVGSCGFSESGGNHYEYRRENSDLPVFDLDYYSNCECCQAELAANQVQFRCDATEEYITISVTQISGCKCMQCT